MSCVEGNASIFSKLIRSNQKRPFLAWNQTSGEQYSISEGYSRFGSLVCVVFVPWTKSALVQIWSVGFSLKMMRQRSMFYARGSDKNLIFSIRNVTIIIQRDDGNLFQCDNRLHWKAGIRVRTTNHVGHVTIDLWSRRRFWNRPNPNFSNLFWSSVFLRQLRPASFLL